MASLGSRLAVNPISVSSAQLAPQDLTTTVIPILPQRPALSANTLEDTIRPSIALLYGEQNADVICERIGGIVQQLREARSATLRKQDETRRADWYRNIVMYSLYADLFATEDTQQPATFDTLSAHLGHLTRLGVDTIHVLPFLGSPMVDAGFDISDYTRVRPELGGNRAFKRFIKKAKSQKLHVMMDMVLNHASEQHPHFQAALRGDLDKISRFIYRREKPQTKRLNEPGEGVLVEYPDGSRIRLMLSDNAETHYNPSVINGKTRYFYSTFMPQQKDWNWKNPDVLFDHLKSIGFWANQGVDIFRLDALPFLVKEPGTNGENTPGMHAVIQTLSACLQVLAPSTVLLAEAAAPPIELHQYYGEEHDISCAQSSFTRTNKVQMTYNFPLMSAIWASFVMQNAHPILKTMNDTPALLQSATQVNFLRVHDELSMERVDPEWQQAVYDALAPKGEGCRGGIGVAGRLADFTDHHPERASLLYSILFSLPGTPLLYYGDELMAPNNAAYMMAAAQRRADGAGESEHFARHIDKRDLNRGPVSSSDLQNLPECAGPGAEVFRRLQRMITMRKNHVALTEGGFIPLSAAEAGTLAYIRETEQERVLVVQNLSDKALQSTLRLDSVELAVDIASRGLRDLLSDQIVSAHAGPAENEAQLSLEPHQALWLKLSQ
jgi:maltose alpha-D-glucosyltransferase/alpha-amylase